MSKCQPPWVAPLFNLDRDMRTRVLTNPSNDQVSQNTPPLDLYFHVNERQRNVTSVVFQSHKTHWKTPKLLIKIIFKRSNPIVTSRFTQYPWFNFQNAITWQYKSNTFLLRLCWYIWAQRKFWICFSYWIFFRFNVNENWKSSECQICRHWWQWRLS